ncbi:hypothetical protein MB901379_02821 [Mycobacterium basiliense]|uniref:Uncharacterized protein n=1 Tax=Mycobacterium basiliense TaxID=2094119 RepID=A0A3S4DU58_9MYCO|nr:hypothetical protein [Mycobacterium basiliense]VDM89251.1 hypothetical protein MB901379_02821 [Mycobacterium basiliense]
MVNQNIEATRNGSAAFNAGDLETVLRTFPGTVEWPLCTFYDGKVGEAPSHGDAAMQARVFGKMRVAAG